MNKINFYKSKYEALEDFYGWIDQGSEYDIAVEQCMCYTHKQTKVDEIIRNITVATRFSRCGREISEQFKKRLKKIVCEYKLLELEEYGLSSDEIKILNEEVEEVEATYSM